MKYRDDYENRNRNKSISNIELIERNETHLIKSAKFSVLQNMNSRIIQLSLAALFLLSFALQPIHCHATATFSQEGSKLEPRSKFHVNETLTGAASDFQQFDVRNGQVGLHAEFVENCDGCKFLCINRNSERYDCEHQNGLVTSCRCNSYQIWPTTCEQCELGCAGYSTCKVGTGVFSFVECTCSSSSSASMGKTVELGLIMASIIFPTTIWLRK